MYTSETIARWTIQKESGTGTADCDFDSTLLTVLCAAYELGGVGNTNATAHLELNFTAAIDCTNKGGELVEVHSQDATATASSGDLSRNGRLDVTATLRCLADEPGDHPRG